MEEMLKYLLDTNILSELRKSKRCDLNVKKWFDKTEQSQLFTSVLVIGEIRRGIENIRRRDKQSAYQLERWLENLQINFQERIIPIDERIAETWGYMNSIRPLPVIDGLLAATTKTYDFILVTRNIKDIQGIDIEFINPFENRT
ncbi:type II toxin-antitoxin system VapC family toxin [Candidatus Halobeggiatoa sp. HSG11]|nr:type II toxin-antitoxin system VapC family toxin [Candidatus Halobeggiatoa sp. HSG11]